MPNFLNYNDMPRGKLFIKTTATAQVNGNDNGWVDAYDTYGLSLDEQGLSRLMTPAGIKSPVVNKNSQTDGQSIVGALVREARSVSLGMHIVARNQTEFFTKYSNFCSQVLANGYLEIWTAYQPSVVYKFVYLDCQQFDEYNGEMALFTLSLLEPHPEDRTGTVPNIENSNEQA